MTPSEIIDRLARSSDVIEFETTPGRAFVLISYLQTALWITSQSDGDHESSDEIVQSIIANLAKAIAEKTNTPEVLTLIELGNQAEFNMTPEETSYYFELNEDSLFAPPPTKKEESSHENNDPPTHRAN
jgi:hypothetical protein